MKIKTFKTEIRLNKVQRIYFAKSFGIHRWTWNWAVATYFEAAKNNKFPTAFDLQKQLNNTLVLDPEYSWLTEVNSMARQEAFKDFGLAIKSWHQLQAKSRRTIQTMNSDKGKPQFKKKGKCPDSFRYIDKGCHPIKMKSNHKFTMRRTKGYKPFVIKTVESIEFLLDAIIKNVSFTREAGRYYVSICYVRTKHIKQKTNTRKATIGIDLGIKHVATCYDGKNFEVYDVPATLKIAEKHTESANRAFSRTQKGSNRHNRKLLRLQRAYKHESNIKRDFREKLTTKLVSEYSEIKVDTFSFKSAKNLDINRSLHRVGVYAFTERLKAKAAEHDTVLKFVPTGTPTTKTCSCCGNKQDIDLSERMYTCNQCGFTLDRDMNSAINVYKLDM